MAKITLTDIAGGYDSLSAVNGNNTLLETAMENTLSRDGTTPNGMQANLDLNTYKLVNVGNGTADTDGANLGQMNTAVAAAAASEAAAAISEANAASSESTASAAAISAAADAASATVSAADAAASAAAAAEIVGGTTELIDLTDVSLATPTNRHALMGNGTSFASRALTEADISDLGSYITSETSHADVLVDGDIGVSVQAYDASIVVDADIGVSVQGYDADTMKSDVNKVVTAEWSVPSIPRNKTTSYTLVLGDAGMTVRMTGSTAAQSITIPANASVAFPIGTLICVENDSSVSWTLPITTDTLTWAKDNTTGTRTLAAGASCVIHKTTATTWKINGSALVT